tara:strand:+ start:211 stop:1263 length:1053 start_codon:yes stop_codon:yes gene_type:complete
MKKVLKPGIFDLFHVGHLNSIKEASEHGDYLIVAVQDDREVLMSKGEPPIVPLHQRIEILTALKYVDEVVSYRNSNLSSMLDFLSVDALCVGEDYGKDHQFPNQALTVEYCKKNNIKIIKTERTNGISSSSIKKNVSKFWKSRKKEKSKPIESSTMLGSYGGDKQKLEAETKEEVNFIKPYLNKYSDVLDLGSGYGRLSIPMAKYSNKVCAVDFSKSLTEDLQEKNIINISAKRCDVVDFNYEKKFDAIVMSGLFPCLDDEQLNSVLRKAENGLNQGGYIIIRSSVSLNQRINIINQYSEALNSLYTAFYRTEEELDDMMENLDLTKIERKDMYSNHEDTKIIMSCFKKS